MRVRLHETTQRRTPLPPNRVAGEARIRFLAATGDRCRPPGYRRRGHATTGLAVVVVAPGRRGAGTICRGVPPPTAGRSTQAPVRDRRLGDGSPVQWRVLGAERAQNGLLGAGRASGQVVADRLPARSPDGVTPVQTGVPASSLERVSVRHQPAEGRFSFVRASNRQA